MASRTDQHGAQNGTDFHHTAFEMEPELETLRGVLVAYRTFAAQTDLVEPAAIAMLAHCREEALERLSDIWRSLLPVQQAE